MHGHDEMEAILDALKQDSTIININVELSLEGIVDKNASFNVDVVVLGVPVCLEGNWHTIPTVRVTVTKTITNNLNDALCQNSWL